MPGTGDKDFTTMTRRRVVITGLGAVTPLGHDFATTWDNLLAGVSGVAPIERYDVSRHTTKIAAMVKNFDPEAYFPGREARHLDTFVQYALVACREAMKDSGFEASSGGNPEKYGAILATGIGGIHEIENQHLKYMQKGARRVAPHFIPMIMPNAISGEIAIRYGLKGPNFVIASACASSAHAIGIAALLIRMGQADLVVSGGAEAATTPLGLAGFSNMKALSTRNDDPQRASRPFDKDRDGFVMGEGAAILVLEELEHARRRGARIYAELKGFGMNDDAGHITAPDPTGKTQARTIRMALEDAGVDPAEVDYVNAHGTSTPLNDKMEVQALIQAFGDHVRKLAISSTKSMVGHILGGSAAVETAVTARSIFEGKIHSTMNFETPDPGVDLDFVGGESREMNVRNAVKNSFGFGGHNAALVLGGID